MPKFSDEDRRAIFEAYFGSIQKYRANPTGPPTVEHLQRQGFTPAQIAYLQHIRLEWLEGRH